MVFGFGKKKTVESSLSTPQQKEILIDDIVLILKEVEFPLISKITEQAKKIRSEIETSQQNIKDTIFHLESDNLKLDDVDRNLKTAANRGKDAVVSMIKKETAASLIDIKSYDDLVTLNLEVSQMLKRMGDILGVHTRVMHVFARKYADRLKNDIAKFSQNRNSLQLLVNEREDFRSKSESILNTGMKIKKLKDEIFHRNKRLAETINEMSQTWKIIEKLEHEADSLKAKNEYKEFLEVKKKIELHSNQKNEIKNKINGQFSKISRPLGKYSYVSSFDKPMRKLMEDLLAEPYEIITAQNKTSIIEILQAVIKSVLAGNISVKDSQKSAEQIEETINRLDEFLKLKDAYSDKISNLEKELAVFDSNVLEEKEKELAKAKRTISDLESSIKKLEKEVSENETLIKNHKSELESALTDLYGAKITVKF
ncbi:MAG: hypothetical protein E6K91_01785 [Thaumarchaeota archaeon]|nr:MAG: hypothetical protein E6K91_01785 [Nitrososphaerota archaeon]